MNEQPLIWTTLGNVPVADLTHKVTWRVEPDLIVCTESYFLKDMLVKESSHVKVLVGAAAEGTATI